MSVCVHLVQSYNPRETQATITMNRIAVCFIISHKLDRGTSRPSTKLQLVPAVTWSCTSMLAPAPGINCKRSPAPRINHKHALAPGINCIDPDHSWRCFLVPEPGFDCINLDCGSIPWCCFLVTVIAGVRNPGDGDAPGPNSPRS